MSRGSVKARAIEQSRRYAASLPGLDVLEPVLCRPCLNAGVETPATDFLLATAAVCDGHAALYGEVADPRQTWLGKYCRRCSGKIFHDRDRQTREIALYGRLTQLCSGCFDEPASDSYLEGPSWRRSGRCT